MWVSTNLGGFLSSTVIKRVILILGYTGGPHWKYLYVCHLSNIDLIVAGPFFGVCTSFEKSHSGKLGHVNAKSTAGRFDRFQHTSQKH